jgi:hypothetical protein
MVQSPGPSLLGDPVPGEVVQAPRSLTAVDPRVTKLGLVGYPNVPSPPTSWR